MSIARLAHSTEDERLEFDCHRVIAKYVEPELKSLEVKGAFSEVRRVTVSLFDDNIEDAVIVDPLQIEHAIVDQLVDGY